MKRNGKVKERVRVDGFWDGRVLMGDCACECSLLSVGVNWG